MTMTKRLARLAGLLILIAILGSALWSFFSRKDQWNVDFIVGITAFSIGIVTFFGVTALNLSGHEKDEVLSGRRLRTAIACSLVMSYLFMVSFTTFVSNAAIIGPVTKEFVSSFSNVIGITIAFYFGASAAIQIFGREKGAQSESQSIEQQNKGG